MKAFYSSLRASFGPLAQNQVDGIKHLVDATSGLPIRQRAYVLATAWHETGPAASQLHMTPRREIWGPTEAQKRYEGRSDLGNTVLGDGKRFMGRGYVQITGRTNYQKASTLVGKDLVANPDLALEPDIAARIIVHGMTRGWFTGRKMSDFLDYQDMRRVVNGMDKAALIAGYAEKFEAALRLLEVTKPVPPPHDEPILRPPPDIEPVDAENASDGVAIAKLVMAAVGFIIAALAAWLTVGG